jgi:hypothetical protein
MKCPRPKILAKEYGWCPKPHHGVIFNKKNGCIRCETEKRRKKEGLCCARLGHGPGHQSSTYCEVKGKHNIHECRYGSYDQIACWKGPVSKLKFTGYFDDPPEFKG